MRRVAIIALGLFAVQAAFCGLGGFGLGTALAASADVVESRTASHCHSEPSEPAPSSEAQKRCRAHCAMVGQGASLVAPAPEPPGGLTIPLASFRLAEAAPPHRPIAEVGRMPPPGNLPILYRSLLL